MSALLHLRGQSQFESDVGAELFRWINSQLTLKDTAYGTNLAYPQVPPPARGSIVGGNQVIITLRLCTLIRQFRRTLVNVSTTGRDEVALQEALTEALELEQFFDPRLNLVSPITIVLTEGSAWLYRDTFSYFPGILAAAGWVSSWSLRLRILRLILDCITLLDPPGDFAGQLTSVDSLLSAIAECADNICNAVPFLTGEVDDKGNFWPQGALRLRGGFWGCMSGMSGLNAVITTPEIDYTRPDMREWAFARLLDIGNRGGLKQAHAFYRFYRARLQANVTIRNMFTQEKSDATSVNLTGGVIFQATT